jgi:hypothetical protein
MRKQLFSLLPSPAVSRNFVVAGICCLLAASAYADWYYRVMKVICDGETLRVIDYSAPNEIGEARSKESDAIDVDQLSTWKRTSNDLNVPDKPKPYVNVCAIPWGKYRVTLTNAGGGYSAPYPVVNVVEISDPSAPKSLITDLHLNHIARSRYEIVFSRQHPNGKVVEE